MSVLYLGISGDDARPTPPPVYTPALPVAPQKSDEDRATEVVRRWLDELKAGGDGSSFWLASNTLEMHHLTSIRPHAVRGYDIQSVRPLQVEPSWAQTGAKKAVAVRFRVDHSGAGGQPVTNEYRVTVFDLGGAWVLGDGARR